MFRRMDKEDKFRGAQQQDQVHTKDLGAITLLHKESLYIDHQLIGILLEGQEVSLEILQTIRGLHL